MDNSVSNTKNNIPLCVDLDGTLIATDTLLESMLIALKINPFILFLFPIWILNGRAHFKAQIAKIALPDPASLPYHQDFMNYVLTEHKSGREIVLATATLQPIADRIAEHLDIFSKVLASTPDHNLRDEKKRKALVDLYGEKGFDYAGDSSADLSVWPSANLAIIVHPKNGVLTKAKQINSNNLVFNKKRNILKSIIKQIRVYQWIKNILLFMPILMAHRFADFGGLIDAGLAFFSFSFTASFVYVLNDLLDLESDRKHPRKRFRPLAAGDISIPLGIALIPLLLIGGIAIALVVNLQFLMILMIYLLLTTLYSFKLKKIMMLDVILLSGLYTIRLLAGSYASGVEASNWLLAFSIFIFLSLAFVKRYTELNVKKQQNKNKLHGRGYSTDDLPIIRTLGSASAYISVLILALYIHSGTVSQFYSNPDLLWLVTLCLLYWISRIWILTGRGEIDDDPIVFTIKDKQSYFIGLIVAILAIGASL
jgi:4-hydroxybenzoate polyprenyltransferase